MYKAIIFDLDGVICHTDNYHYLSWDKISKENNLKFSYELNHKLRGISRLESLNIILKENNINFSNEKKDQILKKKNEYYNIYLNDMSPKDLDSNVLKVLNLLREKNIKLAIGSSSRNARKILDKLQITKYFDCIVDGNDIINTKPNPEVFIKAQEKLEINKQDCLIVEDALSGIIAATNANIDSVAFNISEENNAKYNIKNILELIEII